jgi:RNA polymerase sigma-70 factor (ECF subfamily)
MGRREPTRWTIIRRAAEGLDPDRETFARLYEPVARAYLATRWRDSPLLGSIDDAVQEVFLDCFKEGGVLERAEPGRSGGFRAFFFGVLRKAALNLERKHARRRDRPGDRTFQPDLRPAEKDGLSTVFDRAWATAVLREAGERQAERAEEKGENAMRRVELLRLRFTDGLPIREIARLWDEDPKRLHKQYAKAREEFREALLEVVAYHHPGSPREAEEECAELYRLFG